MRAVLFDLLSALIDSWSLWDDIAGSGERGRRWRFEYLRLTYGTGAYLPYLDLVEESAAAVGLPRACAGELEARWDELAPWPGAGAALRRIARRMPIGVATNCSQVLGVRAAGLIGAPFRIRSSRPSRPGSTSPIRACMTRGWRPSASPRPRCCSWPVRRATSGARLRRASKVVWHNPAGLDAGGAEELAVAVDRRSEEDWKA